MPGTLVRNASVSTCNCLRAMAMPQSVNGPSRGEMPRTATSTSTGSAWLAPCASTTCKARTGDAGDLPDLDGDAPGSAQLLQALQQGLGRLEQITAIQQADAGRPALLGQFHGAGHGAFIATMHDDLAPGDIHARR